MKITWEITRFEDLTPAKLYRILQLRSEVFVVEQNCAYLDPDGKDHRSFHVMGFNLEQEMVAYCRILPEDVSYTEASIGRVLTSAKARKFGIGKLLMKRAIDEIDLLFGEVPVRIGAQLYLKKFYEDLGFVVVSDEYLEDGIKHIEMIRKYS